MATHSSVLAWRIPGLGGLVGCRLWGCTESDTTEATQQQQQQLPSSLFHIFVPKAVDHWVQHGDDHCVKDRGHLDHEP